MKRLVDNGKIVLDGTAPRYQREKEILEQFEKLQNFMLESGIENIDELIDLAKRKIENGSKQKI